MLQPAAITALLSQLINENTNNSNNDDGAAIRPHTAILTLLDSSELYAVATRLVDAPPSKSAVASILASTAAATGTAPPVYNANGRPAPLTLDERAACLSAIAVTSWRQSTEGRKAGKEEREGKVVMPGTTVSVAKHAVTGMTSAAGKKAFTRELVPLLLESDLGSILVMPIVPSAPAISPSRSELAAMDESHDDLPPSLVENPKPFMLLTLNASFEGPRANLPNSPSTPNATSNPALASSTATLSATNPARSRFRSGGTTPTSTRSDNTPTPSRSPVSDHFPVTPGAPHSSSSPLPSGDAEGASAHPQTAAAAEEEVREARFWSALYAQAKALARVLAPSLTKCGVGQQHLADDQTGDGRHSGLVSDDDPES